MKKKIIVKEFSYDSDMNCENGNCELPMTIKDSDKENVKSEKKIILKTK